VLAAVSAPIPEINVDDLFSNSNNLNNKTELKKQNIHNKLALNNQSQPVTEQAKTLTQQTSNKSNINEELAAQLGLSETKSGWSIRIPFVNNYQQTLIDQGMQTILDKSKKHNVDVSLMLAIIEAESSFNPMATSHIPAFGLMQLVPKTAGVDAYNHVYGYKKLLDPEYLYNVENNLELGAAYIDVLQSRYLRGISNDENKLYSVIASYNTGVGNLANTVSGSKRIREAIDNINAMLPQDYYEYLLQNLPALETRNYLKKVMSKREKYRHLDEI